MEKLDIDKGDIMTLYDRDFIVIDYLIKDEKKYLFLKEVDQEENLLETQIIARLVLDINSNLALEEVSDRYMLETLRNEFANRLREEYM